jgi:branched-chain amino acid transport system substrate-binding protein
MAVALTGLVAACNNGGIDKPQTNADPIPVGAVISKTGTYASMGTVQEKILNMEVDKINAAGGIKGRPIKLIIEDDATDESKAVSAAQKLIERDKVVAILGSSGTGATMAIRQLVETAGIPQISMAGGNVITGQFSPNVYQTPWPNRLLIPTLFEYLKAEGLTKVALVTDSGGYGKDGHAIAEEAAAASGVDLVVDLTFDPGDTDMSGQVAQIKASKAQAVVLWSAGKEAVTIVNQAKNAGIELPWFGGSGQARTEFVEGAAEATEGYIIITGKSYVKESWEEGSEQRKVMDEFYAEANEVLGENPDIFAGHGYDAIRLFVNAAQKADAIDGASLIKALDEQTSNFIDYGGAVNFSATDHNGLAADDISFFTLKNGAWEVGALR